MDKHFKNKLKNHKVDWNKEELLGDLQTALSQKENPSKKKWFSLLLLPIFGIGLYWSIITLNSSTTSKIVALTNEKTEASGQSLENLTVGENSEDLLNDLKQKNLSGVSESQKLNSEELTKIGENVKNDLDVKGSSKGLNQNDGATSISKFLKSKAQNRTSDLKELSEVEIKNSDDRKGLEQTSIEKIVSVNISQNENLRKHETAHSNSQITKLNSANNTATQVVEKLPLIELSRLPIEVSSLLLPLVDHNSTLPLLATTETKVIDNNDQQKGIRFYFEPNVSIGLLQPKFREVSDGPDEYLIQKMETEKGILHDAVSLEVGALIKDKWTVQVGLEYQEMREKFSADLVLASDTTMVELDKAYYEVDPNGVDTTFYSGIRPLILNETRFVRHYNRHNYINIPLNVGKRFQIKNTMMQASAGISFALRQNFSGRTLRGANRIIDDESYTLENRVAYQISLGVNHTLSANKDLFVKAVFRQSPTLYFSETYEKYHHSYSLGAGVRFYLGHNK